MKATIFFSAAMLLACGAQNGNGGDDVARWDATLVWSGSDSYDTIAVQDGFVYVELPGTGIERCATSGCTQPSSVLGTDAFVTASIGASTITYATQIMDPSGGVSGEIRAVGVDGTGDRSLLAGAAYPAWVASSGTRTFWADDSFALDETPATIRCVGCTSDGQSTPWISTLGGTYGMIADASNVYVLADDASLTSVNLVACGASAPCFGEPRVVLTGLDAMIVPQRLASDGTSVYVARANEQDVVRVSNGGVVTSIVPSVDATALAFDASSGNIYYATSSGTLGRVKPDGSGGAS
jgi:hypothetical protein